MDKYQYVWNFKKYKYVKKNGYCWRCMTNILENYDLTEDEKKDFLKPYGFRWEHEKEHREDDWAEYDSKISRMLPRVSR